MSEPIDPSWYDWVFLAVFIVHFVGALFWGQVFLRQRFRTRLIWSLTFTAAMFAWIIIHHI